MKSYSPEQIYLKSPTWVQNVLVSIYGYLEHQRRYTGEHEALKLQLKNNEYKRTEELELIKKRKLDQIISTAINKVPYYQKLNIQKLELSEFPLLDRQTVADNTEDFVNRSYKESELIALYTGGSTGNPLKVYVSKAIRQRSYAFWSAFYARMGFEIGDKKASFVGRKLQRPDDDTPPFWRYNLKDRQLLFSSYHMSEQNLPHYLEKLNKFKPRVIEGYPLSIYRLAEYILRNNSKLEFKPTGISTSSENFTNAQRCTMETAFQCKVFDQYGSAESVVFASECVHGKMHIEPEYGIVEILTSEGSIHSEGTGELVVTTLLNDAMPLIRYRIGDLGQLAYEDCDCGRNTAILKNLDGKVGAVIVNGDKRVPTAAIAIAFEYLEGIKNAQIIQNQPSSAIVKLVKKSDFNPETEDYMLWQLRGMLGEGLEISVEYVNEIPPEKNGKYRMVVQNHFIY
ncbi:phenylacetate--CoA ligase family protein [Marinobacter sp. DY40_1A1]|uniref:phenylacetate--CoA ligase family protein n=1 Tax=Marinobacter sp. DY40_1A1 TaxID=2583229 RepID=UPI0019035583|nr:phenylacetate--CoA ligase family protein [Marinobacter sp. DY40_1A1]MBK1885947.1 phenylacetate--CoA ligase family protein [Marinobacter sp. DY40_1A1]